MSRNHTYKATLVSRNHTYKATLVSRNYTYKATQVSRNHTYKATLVSRNHTYKAIQVSILSIVNLNVKKTKHDDATLSTPDRLTLNLNDTL